MNPSRHDDRIAEFHDGQKILAFLQGIPLFYSIQHFMYTHYQTGRQRIKNSTCTRALYCFQQAHIAFTCL